MGTRRRLALALVCALTAAAVAGCGGGDSTVTSKVLTAETEAFPGDIGQWVIEIEADPGGDLAYTVDEVVSPPGNTNIVFENPQAVKHDVVLETPNGKEVIRTELVKQGMGWARPYLGETTRYIFYCSVPGHREAGMEGVITIDSSLEESDLDAFATAETS